MKLLWLIWTLITVSLKNFKDDCKNCISAFRMANILGENFVENVKMETDNEETESLLAQIRQLLQLDDGRLMSTFWSGGFNGTEI